ncbi:hypothetical protein L1887_03535 [Cichorium endivia]|nr:hypothetical protein L1887_03535 [Cichorium endivia]
MKKLELVFVPILGYGHLKSAIEFAKCLLDRDERLSITFLVIIPLGQTDIGLYTKSLAASNARMKYTMIPPTNPLPQGPQPSSRNSFEKLASLFIESHKPQVERAVMDLVSDDSTHLLGFVLDMFCSCMIDVANKFSVPSYIFFTSNTAFLGFLLHLPVRHSQVGVNFNPSDPESLIPSYQNHVPTNVLPGALFDKTGGGYEAFLYLGTKFQECKGLIVNSYVELESYAVNSMVAQPTLYPVGPLLDHKNHNKSNTSTEIINWLDNQPSKSVLFLCFGSMGSFKQSQIEQIAIALERSDHRFLWSIREPPPSMHGDPSDYTSYENVMPDGFFARVKERGMVCGWAPQIEVLAHGAVKGFVTHCGWNSILESLWYGVPIATWPLNAEQQLNAFLTVRELGVAVELSLTYRSSGSELVMANQIERAINCLMDDTNPVRERVKKISQESRKALINGGSSFVTLGKLVEDMLQNIGEY